jgi:hypothetical protein
MWTYSRIINSTKTEAYFTCAFEATNEHGETVSFFHQYKDEPPEQELLANAQNHIDAVFNAATE